MVELLEKLKKALRLNLDSHYEFERRRLGITTAAEASSALFGWADETKRHYSFSDCLNWYGKVMTTRGPVDADMLLQRHGIKHIRELPPDMYNLFGDYARVSYQFGISPTAPWYGEHDVPIDLRDRFLIYHPESDALFISKRPIPFNSESMDIHLCCEVTGIDDHEQRVEQTIADGYDVYSDMPEEQWEDEL